MPVLFWVLFIPYMFFLAWMFYLCWKDRSYL